MIPISISQHCQNLWEKEGKKKYRNTYSVAMPWIEVLWRLEAMDDNGDNDDNDENYEHLENFENY